MSEIETFDPRIFSSPSAMVEALQGLNISLSQRLGVRIFAMGAQRIQFSLAILELLAQSPSLQADLSSPKLGLSGANDPTKRIELAGQLRELLQDQAEVLDGSCDENGIELLQIVSADEAMLFQLTQQPTSGAERALMTTQSQALPRLLGNQAQYLPKGSTFDLAGGAGVARGVGNGLDLQAPRQIGEQAAGVGAAHVHHQHKGHAVERVAFALLDGADEAL